MRLVALLLLSCLTLTACTKADEEARQQAIAEQIRITQQQQLRQASLKLRLDYAWRTQIVRMCRHNGKYVLRGPDGRLWVSGWENPGRAASNGGYRPYAGTTPEAWDPDEYMTPVADIDPKDICE